MILATARAGPFLQDLVAAAVQVKDRHDGDKGWILTCSVIVENRCHWHGCNDFTSLS
jgi:hypothetical protein